jgi:hypothetical protein
VFRPPEQERAVEVLPRVFVLNFPSDDRKHRIKEILTRLSGEYKIWNVSEYTYDSAFFDFNVADYSRPGYPCPPLQDLLIVTREMAHWLDANPANLLFIHCQQNFGRSTLVLACLFYALRIERDMATIEATLTARLNSTLLGNQRLYLKYFESCMGGIPLNRNPVILRRVVLSEKPFVVYQKSHLEQPNFEPTGDFRPYLQIFMGKHIVFNSLQKYR